MNVTTTTTTAAPASGVATNTMNNYCITVLAVPQPLIALPPPPAQVNSTVDHEKLANPEKSEQSSGASEAFQRLQFLGTSLVCMGFFKVFAAGFN